jgi:hypothetical protein
LSALLFAAPPPIFLGVNLALAIPLVFALKLFLSGILGVEGGALL